MCTILRALAVATSTCVVSLAGNTEARAGDAEVIRAPAARFQWIGSVQYAHNPVSAIADGTVLHGRIEVPLLQRVKNDRTGLAIHDGVFAEAAIPYPDKGGFFTTAYVGGGYELLAGLRTRRVGVLLGLRAEGAAWAAPNGGFYSFVVPLVLRVEAFFYDEHKDRPFVLTAWASMLEQPFFDLQSPGQLLVPSRVMGGRLDVPAGKRFGFFGSIQNTQGTQVLWKKKLDGEGLTAWEFRFGLAIDL